MKPKALLKSAIAGFTAFAMAATLLPIGRMNNVQAAETGSTSKQQASAVTARNAAGTPETTDYIFAYFPYTKLGGKDERIYFGISEDGLNFTALNNQQPVLESKLGTHGLRDPFIIRSHEGNKFYLLATDLNVAPITVDGIDYPQRGFDTKTGSKSIMVWESTDLVTWSEQRECKVAPDNAGCTWAPEAYWDDETQQYVVFWASTIETDGFAKQNLYYATTSDFRNFSEPVVWIEETGAVIDTTVIKVGDYYYRYTKNEEKDQENRYGTHGKHIYCERSKSLTSTKWEFVHNDSLACGSKTSIEGPCIYKLNDDDRENAKKLAAYKNITLDDTKDIYCLIADNNGSNIFPGISDDITTGSFSILGQSDAGTASDGTKIYSMPKPTASHGTIMPITSEEYNNLRLKWDVEYREAAEPYVTQVEDDTAALTLPEKVSSYITLRTTALWGSEITWESSNPSIIATNGKVNRPTYRQGDATVTLTATIAAKQDDDSASVRVRDQIRTKSFQVTVEKLPQENFTVTFNSNGGSAVNKQTVADGSKAAAPKNPAKKGYTFEGWYNGNAKYNFNSDVVTGNLTLTAKWTKVTVKAPSKPTLKNSKSKQMTVTIKKVSGAAGYQVTYSTDKKFKKKVTKKDITKNTLTIKKLKKNTTYYVKVKAYKKDSAGKKVYSSKFSTVSNLKIKK